MYLFAQVFDCSSRKFSTTNFRSENFRFKLGYLNVIYWGENIFPSTKETSTFQFIFLKTCLFAGRTFNDNEFKENLSKGISTSERILVTVYGGKDFWKVFSFKRHISLHNNVLRSELETRRLIHCWSSFVFRFLIGREKYLEYTALDVSSQASISVATFA